MLGGHLIAMRSHCVIELIPLGHMNVPSSTWLNALVMRFASVKMPINSDIRNGVFDAHMNL